LIKHPDPKYGDATRAVKSATRACALTEWKNAGYLNLLAAAYAKLGDLDEAIKWQTRAVDLVPKGEEARRDDYHKTLRYDCAEKKDRKDK
jgi:hypothetical protein